MKKLITLTVCTEGATLNGITVTREQIQDMADTYSQALYPARLNLEHIRSLWPDSDFRHYGLVKTARAVELTDGPLKGKLSLEADIELDEDQDGRLIQLNRSGQKLFSSIEFYERFPQTGKAYLTGIAVTDTPAACGTQRITLSRSGAPENAGKICRTSAVETRIHGLTEDTPQPQTDTRDPGFLSRISQLLRGQRQLSEGELRQLRDAVELTANELSALKQQLSLITPAVSQMEQQQRTISELREDLSALKQQLSLTPDNSPGRHLSTGVQYENSEF